MLHQPPITWSFFVEMSALSEAALEKKLSELSNSQQSVQTLSLWLIHHRKHSQTIVTVWLNELKKGTVNVTVCFGACAYSYEQQQPLRTVPLVLWCTFTS